MPNIVSAVGAVTKLQVVREVAKDTLGFIQRLLAPIAEATDFLTDKVRYYRWRSALRTLAKAREFSEQLGIDPRPVPIKFLVPFLEKCSLEEEDSPLIDKWARLLASATAQFKDEHLTYSSILSHIGPPEAQIMADLWRRATKGGQDPYQSPAMMVVTVERLASEHFGQWLTARPLETTSQLVRKGKKLISELQETFDAQGLLVTAIAVPVRPSITVQGQAVQANFWIMAEIYERDSLAIHSLSREQLVELKRVDCTAPEKGSGHVLWLQLTPLGAGFMRACGGPAERGPDNGETAQPTRSADGRPRRGGHNRYRGSRGRS